MKRYLIGFLKALIVFVAALTFFFFAAQSVLFGQAPTLSSARFFGGTGDQRGTGIHIFGGNIYLSGINAANGQSLALKYAIPPASSPVWSINWPNVSSGGGEQFFGVAASSDAVYLAGLSYSQTTDNVGGKEAKTVLVKFPLDGATGPGTGGATWVAAPNFFPYTGGEHFFAATSAVESGSTFIYATGNGQDCGNNHVFLLAKFNSSGTLLSKATDTGFSFTSTACTSGFSAGNGITVLNGNIYAVGRSRFEDGTDRPFLVKYDSSLNRTWRVRPSTIQGEFFGVTGFGGALYAVGFSGDGNVPSTKDYLIQKYDEAGTLQWSKTSGGLASDVLTGVVGIGNRIYAVGYTASAGSGGFDAVILEINPATGDTLSTTYYGGTLDDQANGAATDGSNLYIVGESKSFLNGDNLVGSNDLFLLSYTLTAATKLTFLTSPANSPAGTSFGATVAVQDENNNTVTTDNSTQVTVAIKTLTGTAGATLSGTKTVTVVNGVATFSGLSIDKVGSNYQLTATSGTLTSADSAIFNITPGALAKFLVSTPAALTAGTHFSLSVTAQDTFGNTVADGGLKVPLLRGFTDLGCILGAQPGTGTVKGFVVVKSGGSVVEVNFEIRGGVSNATYLVDWTCRQGTIATIQTDPNGDGGAHFTVPAGNGSYVFDAYAPNPNDPFNVSARLDNLLTPAVQEPTGAITGSVNLTTNAGVITPSSITFVSGDNGMHTENVTVTQTGANKTVTATKPTTNETGTSAPFTVFPGAATQLTFTVSPSNTTAGVSFGATVAILDALSNIVTTDSSKQVTLAIKSETGGVGATLGGTTTVTASAGLAAFSGLSITKAAAGYQLRATSGSLTADSSPFNIDPGPLHHFSLLLTTPQTNGVAFSGANMLTAQDQSNNTVTSFGAAVDNVTVTVSPADGTITGLGSANGAILNQASDFVSGVANLTGKLKFTGKAGNHTFTATSSTGKVGTSNVVLIQHGPASKLVFLTPQQTLTAGVASAAISVQRQDLSDNPVTSAAGPFVFLNEALAQAGSWATKASLITARTGLQAEPLGGAVYVIGGTTGGCPQPAALASEAYDPVTNTWIPKAALPPPPGNGGQRSEFATAVVNGKIYAFGGGNCLTFFRDVQVYDPTSNSWSVRPSMPTTRAYGVAAAVNGKIYVIGGYINPTGPIAPTYEYDPPTETWITKAAMPTPRIRSGVAVTGGKIYVVGGQHATTGAPVGTVEAYDPTTNIWTSLAPMSTARVKPAVGVGGHRIYAFGGSDSSWTIVDTGEVYDPALNSWSAAASLPAARTASGVAALGGVFYVIGGQGTTMAGTTFAFTPSGSGTTITVNLTTTATTTGTFRNATDTADITSINIADGSSTADFKYRDTKVGSPQITASFTGLASDTQTETIVHAPLDHFVLSLASPQTNTIAFVGTNTLTAQDFFSNTVLDLNAAVANVTVTVNPADGVVTGLGSGNSAVLNQATDFVNGVANLTGKLTFTGTAGTHTFTVSSSGKTGLSNPVLINPSVPTKVVFVTAAQTFTAGVSGVITIQRQDVSSNATTLGGTLTVNLTTSATSGAFRDFADTNNNVLSVTISDGAMDGSFRYRDTKVGNPIITLSPVTAGISSATQTETVIPAGLDHFVIALVSPQINNEAFTGTNTITARDEFQNVITDFNAAASNVTVTVSPADGSVSGLGASGSFVLNQSGDFVNGVADLTGKLKFTGIVGNHTFTFSALGKSTTSSTVLINPGTPTKLAFVSVSSLGNASNPNAGAVFNVVVESQDVSGNASNLTANTLISLSLQQGTGTLTGTLSLTLAAGPSPRPDQPHTANRVTFTNVTYDKREEDVILKVSASGGNTLSPAFSSPFDVFFATYFPILYRGSDKFVGYAFANPSTKAASLILEAYSASGTMISGPGITNPATVTIPAQQQVAKVTTELFGANLTSGWVVAKSLDDYRGFFLEGALNGSTIDGTDARGQVSTEVIFPNAVDSSSRETTLVLFNPTVNAVSGTLQLFDATGSRASSSFSLNPGQRLEGNLKTLFPGLGNVDGYVRATVTGGLTALAGYQTFGPSTGDFVALRAQDAAGEAGTEQVFAHVVEGAGYEAVSTIINPTLFTVSVTLTFVQDGSGSGSSSTTFDLAGNGMVRKSLREFFPTLSSTSLNVGYLKATSTGGSILGSIYFLHKQNGATAALPGQKTASAKLTFSHVAVQDLSVTSSAWLTGLALLNTSAHEATLTITVYKPDGTKVGTLENFKLGAGKRVSKLLAELVREVRNQAGGYVVVESKKSSDNTELPIYGFELFGDWQLKKLASVPAQ